MHQHLFWVAVGVLQQGEPTLYSVGLELMEACIKALTTGNDKLVSVSLSHTPLHAYHILYPSLCYTTLCS